MGIISTEKMKLAYSRPVLSCISAYDSFKRYKKKSFILLTLIIPNIELIEHIKNKKLSSLIVKLNFKNEVEERTINSNNNILTIERLNYYKIHKIIIKLLVGVKMAISRY